MQELRDGLTRIEAALEKNPCTNTRYFLNPQDTSQLQPGLTDREIEEIAKDLPFCLSDEVYELYRWHNGGMLGYFFSFCYFYPLKEVVEDRQKLVEVYRDLDDPEMVNILENSLPIFQEQAQWMLLITGYQTKKTQVIYFDPEGGYLELYCRSLTSLVLTIADYYEGFGVFYNYLGEKENRKQERDFALLLCKHNPDLVEETLKEIYKFQNTLSKQKIGNIDFRLRTYKIPKSVDPLIQTLDKLNQDSSQANTQNNCEIVSLQSRIIGLLGSIGDRRAVEILIRYLSHQDKWIRYEVVNALGKLGDSKAVEPLIQTLSDIDFYVRMSSATALGRLEDPRAIEALIQTLGDEKQRVQECAASALLSSFKVLDLVLKALENNNRKIKIGAIRALEREVRYKQEKDLLNTKQRETIVISIEKLKRDSNCKVRRQARKSLRSILGQKTFIEKIISNLLSRYFCGMWQNRAFLRWMECKRIWRKNTLRIVGMFQQFEKRHESEK
ncbi:MAG: HEAT repeat domain-containing protein [Cyanobacteria bacterium P01_E01_bin.42]